MFLLGFIPCKQADYMRILYSSESLLHDSEYYTTFGNLEKLLTSNKFFYEQYI